MAGKVFQKESPDTTGVDIGTQPPPTLDQFADAITEVRAADPAALTLADLVAALRMANGNDDESMRKRAAFEAEAYKRLEREENTEHPGISVYSNIEGDRINPKPPLKCPMFWVGYDERVETLTPEEVDLFNDAEPGEFQYHKTDGTLETLTVTAQRGPAGLISKLDFHFPCRGENRNNQPTKAAMLRETQGKRTREQELLAEIAALRSERQKLVVEA